MDRTEFLTLIKKLASFGATPEVKPEVELEEVTPEPTPEPTPEVVAAPEVVAEVVEEVVVEEEAPIYATKAELEEAVNTLKSLFSKQQEIKDEEIVSLKKQLDEKPDAAVITPTPKTELNSERATFSMDDLSIFK